MESENHKAMSEIYVQLKDGAAAQLPSPVTVAEALKKLDSDLAKQALAARVNGREVDLAFTLDASQQNGEPVRIEPVLPQTLEGLDVLRHSTAHLLAAMGSLKLAEFKEMARRLIESRALTNNSQES